MAERQMRFSSFLYNKFREGVTYVGSAAPQCHKEPGLPIFTLASLAYSLLCFLSQALKMATLTPEILFQVGKKETEQGAFVPLSPHQTTIYLSYPEHIAIPNHEGEWD